MTYTNFRFLFNRTRNVTSWQKESIFRRCVQTGESAKTKKYTASVLLPQTKFATRLSGKKRVDKDNYLLEKCGFSELYGWQRINLPGPDFILHDGPPYANGKPHMGHAINKILKDITIRSKVIRGQRVHFVPGWDCHGLPIELKALTDCKNKSTTLTSSQIRQEGGRVLMPASNTTARILDARRFAQEAAANQRQVFASWGVMADWKESGCYFTYETSYVKNQLHQFMNLYEKGLIFRDFKPVHWSPSSRTALAEAELEYNTNHKSKCATVRLLVNKVPPALKTVANQQIYALVWTTTPWSLIANQAVAYAADVKYCLAEDAKGNLNIIAEELLNSIVEKIGALKPVISITGNELAGARYLHPLTNISLPFLPGSHVTNDKGTGLVHIAPAHGPEDFLLALENKIPVLSLVDEEGRYTSEAGPKFAGLEVLGQGAETILENLGQNLLHVETLVHSYPYDWRTKKPVIMRASKQWFIDTGSIKQEALANLQNLEVYPKQNAVSWTNGLRGQIERRPYWCISRQRAWGTPIPVLYRKSFKEIFTSRDLVERLCHLIVKYGPDCWWDFPVEKLMGKELLKRLQVDSSDFEKGQDIMDIWLDSGLSWSRVLPEGKADLYLEGMDQFNGWFQSSLLTSVALQGSSPFKALFVHGFAVDEKARKMSKSVGNIVDPEVITKGGKDLQKNPAYGVDTLRWWVAAHGSQRSQVPVGENILRESAISLQKIRSTLRFLLGSLHPYVTENSVEPQYLLLDKYMLHQLYHYDQKIKDLYDNYQYHHVCQSILNFVSNDISAEYLHFVKDRVYCEAVNSPYRAGAIDVIGEILLVLVRSLAPVVPHLAEEVWLYHPENLTSVHFFHTSYKLPDIWNQPEVVDIINAALQVKRKLNKTVNTNTWEFAVSITAGASEYSLLSSLQRETRSSSSELCDILQVSSVTLIENHECVETQLNVEPTGKSLCQRCRRHPEPQPEEACMRCSKVLGGITS